MIILAVIGIVISIKSLFDTGKDTITAKKEVVALIEGEIMPEEKKKKSQIYKKVGLGLKTKLILFSTALISSVVIIIFVAFGFYTIRNQKITLASSLENQTKVMLESIASGSKIYLPQTTSDDNLSLVDITNQISALKESRYATIIGYPEENDSTLLDSVWATTDKDILEKIDTETVIPGHSRLLIPELEQIHENLENINTEAKESAEELSINIMELTKEALSLVDKTDAESIRRRLEIQRACRECEANCQAGVGIF